MDKNSGKAVLNHPSTCVVCGNTKDNLERKNGKCRACSEHEEFLRSLSGDALHRIYSGEYSLKGGRK